VTTNQYVIVTPVRDEIRHVERTLNSVARQTLLPLRWVIVDDGSTDGTAELLDHFALGHHWIRIIHRTNRGYRAAGGGVMDAFYAGFELAAQEPWDFVVKLDADLSFDADYFEQCFARFNSDARLGVAGGIVYSQEACGLELDSAGDPPFHVRGATKIYRRACWEQISPLIKAPGWDTVDEVRANCLGWTTRTFEELRLIQHKPTGSADGAWRDSFKNGKANYLTGYHPAFMLAKCARRLLRRPYGVQAAGLLAGFLCSYLERLPHMADAKTVRYLRRQQLRRLFLRPSIYG
jgi:poly-beta-1,6-N-acetyl-D-glucosamine synthase